VHLPLASPRGGRTSTSAVLVCSFPNVRNHDRAGRGIDPGGSMSKVRRRRNHSITALGLIAAALLIGLSSLQDLVVLQAPAARIQALGVLEVDLQPDGAVEPDEEIQPIVLVCAAGLFLSGLLLLITRVRYLGVMWRLVALGSLLLPIVLAVTYWMFVDDPKRALVSQDDPALQEMIRTGALALNDALGGGFEPRAGLYVLTAGCMLALISVFIPAIRRDVVLPGPMSSDDVPMQSG
jgi:hypothetical protein